MHLNSLHIVCYIFLSGTAFSQPCAVRKTDKGAVCVCNSTYCDTTPNINVEPGKYNLISTSETNPGFKLTVGELQTNTEKCFDCAVKVKINYLKKYQTVIGFGGAFTDSTGLNIASLPSAVQNFLMESYFGKNGNEYNFCRVPIGGADFSPRYYTLDENKGDVTLEKFALQEEDLKYKIPFMQKALSLRNNQIKFLGSVWTAPTWMKSNGNFSGISFLKHEFYQVYVNYFIKFFEEYLKKGLNFWGMTVQNEPIDGRVDIPINDMGWNNDQMNDYVGTYLGPTLKKSEFKDIKVIVHDDQRFLLPLIQEVINNETTLKYIDGVAVHWYSDNITPAFFLNFAKTPKKDLFLIYSEACNGFLYAAHVEAAVELGSWKRGVKYFKSILEVFKYNAAAWIDWNMVLDTTGGPLIIKNNVDSPIIANKTSGEFYKQPMFYALGQFSKYIIPGSRRIETSLRNNLLTGLKAMAFLRPDGLTAVALYNKKSKAVKIEVETNNGNFNTVEVEANSMNTLIFH